METNLIQWIGIGISLIISLFALFQQGNQVKKNRLLTLHNEFYKNQVNLYMNLSNQHFSLIRNDILGGNDSLIESRDNFLSTLLGNLHLVPWLFKSEFLNKVLFIQENTDLFVISEPMNSILTNIHEKLFPFEVKINAKDLTIIPKK